MKVVILGGGISGLSLGFWLKPFCDVVVLEKESQVGGWLQSHDQGGFLFDKGPRTFRLSPIFIDLIQALGLESEMILSAPGARKRYLFQEGRLKALSKWMLLPALLREWRIPPYEGEETIGAFARRRLGDKWAETLFDPLTLGVYGGDMEQLSMNACFPALKKWELQYGSLARGFWREFKAHPLFSFREGSGVLTRTLAARLGDSLKMNQTVLKVNCRKEGVTVVTSERSYCADYVVSSLPPPMLLSLFPHLDSILSQFKMGSLQVATCGFDKPVLPVKGFGYLVPTHEQESLMGCLFDSEIFPQHNRQSNETRLTMMMRPVDDPEGVVQDVLKRHLHIHMSPQFLHVTRARDAIPQLQLGHSEKVKQLKEMASCHYPRLYLAGNYLKGVSVADALGTAQELVELVKKISIVEITNRL